MTVAEARASINSWNRDERLLLLDELWESLDRDQFVPELTPDLRQLLDDRIAHADAHPDDVLSWEQMKVELDRERDDE